MREPLKLLFKFPCRGRRTVFFESLDSLNDNIRDRNNYHIALTLDVDDEILNNEEVIKRLYEYENVSIQWGHSKSKIEAINRDFPDYDWDVVICWSNDMFLTFFGADDVMRDSMYNIINNHGDDFLLHLPDLDAKEWLNVLYIASKKYYDRFGYIYHPSYLSLWCDNESMDVAKMLGKYHYVGIPNLFIHKNPAYSHHKVDRDELFNIQQGFWEVDELNYKKRKELNFDLPLTEDK